MAAAAITQKFSVSLVLAFILASASAPHAAALLLSGSGGRNASLGAKLAPQLQETSAGNETILRPQAGGPADVVAIGMICKSFYSLDVKNGASMMDLVTVMRWKDPRVVSQLPAGAEKLTLSEKDAGDRIWLPDMGISNRDKAGVEEISSATTLYRNSTVLKIDRFIVSVRGKFDARSFPWDSPVVVVRAASSTLMSDELVFIPIADESFWGVDPEVFTGRDIRLANVTLDVVEDAIGPLNKSRAELKLRLHRVASAYMPSVVVPEIILVTLANTVFYLPLLTPFVMPRVATSIITLLSVIAHRESARSELPARNALSWVDIFEEVSLLLVYACGFFNVMLEGMSHGDKNHALAEQMNQELKLLMPVVAVVCLGLCFVMTEPEGIPDLAFTERCILICCLGGYSLLGMSRRFVASTPSGERSAPPCSVSFVS